MNLLGSNREIVENKLILLYILDTLDMQLSDLQLTRIVLENSLMNYFYLQQFLNDLAGLELLEQCTENGRNLYSVTRRGRETLRALDSKIPAGTKKRIQQFLMSKKQNIRREILVTAEYTPENEHKYYVSLGIHEDSFSLIEMDISAGSRKDAREICSNWKKYSKHIYAEIIDSLIKKRNKD